MANYNFNKDLAIGEKGEKDVLFDLESMGGKFIDDNKDNCYDLLVEKGGIQLKYEIKTDVYCFPQFDTGNMFIEFECRGKTSGVEVTKADWFVMHYKYLKEIWYIKTNELKELIKNNQFFKTEFSGDQNSNTKGYLIPREEYKEYFIVRKIK
tara:strand:+ start:787 stop:1242 length:456 start_codon:yes stop_codon:yes gene_type:complete